MTDPESMDLWCVSGFTCVSWKIKLSTSLTPCFLAPKHSYLLCLNLEQRTYKFKMLIVTKVCFTKSSCCTGYMTLNAFCHVIQGSLI